MIAARRMRNAARSGGGVAAWRDSVRRQPAANRGGESQRRGIGSENIARQIAAANGSVCGIAAETRRLAALA